MNSSFSPKSKSMDDIASSSCEYNVNDREIQTEQLGSSGSETKTSNDTAPVSERDTTTANQTTTVQSMKSHTKESRDKKSEEMEVPGAEGEKNSIIIGDGVAKEENSDAVATTNNAPAANASGHKPKASIEVTTKPLSKKQLKKRIRYEKAMERKRRRKEQEKEAKRAKALAEGRDLEEERRLQEERTKSGEGNRRRQELWNRKIKTAETSFRVCFDCSYEKSMTSKEIGSLALQIRYAYAANKRCKNPCYISVSSLSGATYEHLRKVEGFPDQWRSRAFDCSEKSLLEMHPNKSKLVYLTSDSNNTLKHLDDSKTYVIGGMVDRNRLKRAAISKAEKLGIETAKLPISSYLKVGATKILTCNHVFEILLKYREHGNDWKKAMIDVLPERKEIEEICGNGTNEKKI